MSDLSAVISIPPRDHLLARSMRSGRVVAGLIVLGLIAGLCIATLFWTLDRRSSLYFDGQNSRWVWRSPPSASEVALWFGVDSQGRSLLARCLLGGVISLAVGVAGAMISVVLGVSVGLIAGYKGGWIDALLMRFVDVMYGLPYVLLIIILKIGLTDPLMKIMQPQTANLAVLFLTIGLVSWLTMARVIRGQVLSLRAQPFVEAARAMGVGETRIFLRHLLPNLIGPITVYATLTVPQAILQESFLSFLGIGIQRPLPTWGSLASESLDSIITGHWWLLLFPCILLALTLLSLNFLGDGMRDVLDPRREAAKL